MTRGPIVTPYRPVCNVESPTRCRRTAVWSLDGIYVCRVHWDDPPPSMAMLTRMARANEGLVAVAVIWTGARRRE